MRLSDPRENQVYGVFVGPKSGWYSGPDFPGSRKGEPLSTEFPPRAILKAYIFIGDGRPHGQGRCQGGDHTSEPLSGRLYSHLVTVTGYTHFLDSKMRLASAKAGV